MSEERIIGPDDDDWDWRAGQRLIDEVVRRCFFLSRQSGTRTRIIERDLYQLDYWVEEFHIYVGHTRRVKIYAIEGMTTIGILATHTQGTCDWIRIQTRLLPLLRSMMVLDDMAGI